MRLVAGFVVALEQLGVMRVAARPAWDLGRFVWCGDGAGHGASSSSYRWIVVLE